MQTRRVFYYDHLAHPRFAEVLGTYSGIALERIDAGTPAREVEAVLASAHAYQIGSDQNEMPPAFLAGEPLLERMPNALVVSTHGSGYDTVDLGACTRAGVIALNQAGGNAEAVAEHIVGMMLCLSKRIMETDRFMRREAGIRRVEFMGHDVLGKTIAIIGLGHVGTRTAELCRGLFRMRVLACDPYLPAAEIGARGAEKATLEEALRNADFVSVSCPLTAETRGMIGAPQYAMMREHAYFITTARGGIHDEAALAEALRDRRIAGAGLDVWDPEPPSPKHPLLGLDNVIVSPHTAGVTHESRTHTAEIAARQLAGALEGRRPPRLLNPEAWPAFAKRYERAFGVTV
jgi:D-3-phosphoglycerate dehydrogenase